MTEEAPYLGICSLRYLEFQLGVNRDLLREVAAKAGSYYRPFPKRKGGKIRWIDNPVDPLKYVQRRINRWLLSDLIEFRISKGTIPHLGHGKSEA